MSYDPSVLRQATLRLEEESRLRRERAERMRAEAYARQPRLEQLDRRIRGTMAGLVAAALRQGSDPVQAGQKKGAPPSAREERRAREDMERMRRLMEQMKQEGS